MGTKGTTQRGRFSKDTLNAYIEGRARELSDEISRAEKVWNKDKSILDEVDKLGACIRELRALQQYFNLNR